MRRSDQSLAAALAFIIVAANFQAAEGQTVPISGSGTNASFNPATGDYSGQGDISHLGNATFEGSIAYVGDFFPESGVFFAGTFEGSQNFVAANGDELFTDVTGEVLLKIDAETGLVFGEWLANWEITGGTGRFEGATGYLEGAAINHPFDPTLAEWPFDWYLSGQLNKAKSKK